MSLSPFHISVPVSDLAAARRFYGELLGCSEGRSAEHRIDFNFFGHHLVTHLEPGDAAHRTTDIVSAGVKTPCRHFGLVLAPEQWKVLAERLQKAGADFYLEPQKFHEGLAAEQECMLVHDNCGNIVEFKATPTHGLFTKSVASSAAS
jgi:uncharacterized protein